MPLLAELPDPNAAASIGWVLIALASLIVIANGAMDFWHKIKEKPSGGEALRKALEMFATKAEVNEVKEEVKAVDADLQQLKTDIVTNGELRKNFIVSRLDDVRKEAKEDCNAIHRRIDDLPLRIKEMIKS